ncbi:Glycogenin [Carabus blaptoides fortunei]
MGDFAWVTLATNDTYSLGALVVAHSLRNVGTSHQLVVMVTPGVTAPMREKLASVFNVVFEVNILDSKDETNLMLLQRPELGVTFTKLHCWRLTQFKKCVFLDADTLVLQKCDELFEREELSAAPDVGWPDCFNSGVYVYTPSEATYDSLVRFALEKGSFDGGDQGLLNLYFSGWAHQDINKHLPFIYNMCSTACYSYLPAFKQFGDQVKIIHFIGASKPWLQYFNTETMEVTSTPGFEHLKMVFEHWWNVFCTHVHSTLSPIMGGLAGAFAQMTLGEPRSPTQSALEEHMRRQGWEVGRIDYLGQDSFDNIWKKICQTLSEVPQKEPSPSKELTPAEVCTPVEPIAAASAEVTPAVTAEPTPAAIAELTPVATAESTPAANVEPTPAAIAEPTPVTTAEPTPAAIAEPTSAATVKPTPAAIADSIPAATDESTPAATAESTPAATAEPTPAATAESTLAAIVERTPAITAESTAAVTAEPTPVATTEPTPAAIIEPTLAATQEPTPAATTKPTPAATAEPTPAATQEPTPAATTESTLAATQEPTPAATAEPTPAATAEPTPAAIVEPTPAAPAETTAAPITVTPIQITPATPTTPPAEPVPILSKIQSKPIEVPESAPLPKSTPKVPTESVVASTEGAVKADAPSKPVHTKTSKDTKAKTVEKSPSTTSGEQESAQSTPTPPPRKGSKNGGAASKKSTKKK